MKPILLSVLVSVSLAAAALSLSIGQSVVVPAASRSGTFTSPTVGIPTNASLITAQATGIPTADYENAANSLDLKIQSCLNASCAVDADFIDLCEMTWVGGHRVGKDGTINAPPETACGIGGRNIDTIRAVAVIPRAMTVGATFKLQ